MSAHPVIGVSAWLRSFPTYLGAETLLYTLAREYADGVTQAGGLPFILPHGRHADKVLDLLDGLLLTGGDDLHPESYHEAETEHVQGANLAADEWEIALVRGAAARRMPLLAICRGMQVLAAAFGGRLDQHISGLEGHPDLGELMPSEILAQRHPVRLEPDCQLARIYGEIERQVNTIHHQAVLEAGELRIVGTGPGGVVEAIEAIDGWQAIGVQWHPEKMDEPEEQQVFRHFITEAEKYGERRRKTARERTSVPTVPREVKV